MTRKFTAYPSYIRASAVYYNTQNLPRQDYTIISHVEQNGRWTSKQMMKQAMYPWKNIQPEKVVAYYELLGEDGKTYLVDGETLKMSLMHRFISITNARIEGYEVKYWRT
jgi:hypothetical protein